MASTVTSGGIEQNFAGMTPGEALTLAWDCVDNDDVAITSFAGWTGTVYILASAGAANGPDALSTGALLAITITFGTAPRFTAAMTKANWTTINADMKARDYYYEAWRTNSGAESRLAYGLLECAD